jgi:tetratricopeptide (TPR) repeat protein
VLITSRERGWSEVGTPVEVDVLARPESVAILQGRVPGLTGVHADRLAAELGDLPLAVAQAAGFMAETGMAAVQYLGLVRTRAGQLMAQAAPGSSYPRSLAAATQLIADQLAENDPAAAQLANLCACLAPEPVPEDLFTGTVSVLPGALAARAADPLAWHQTLAYLARQSLARIDGRGLQMHRLTQAILRDLLTPDQTAAARACVEMMLIASGPGDPDNPATWPRWAQLMPHLLAVGPATADSSGLRQLACDACWYLLAHGDSRTAYDLATDLRRQWTDQLGQDHEHALEITRYLGWALQAMGRYRAALDLDQDTLDRMRQFLGEDHPHTLATTNHVVNDLRLLGERQAARDLAQGSLDRKRQVLGEDDPDTLRTAQYLAATLRELGDARAARDLNQDTLDRQRRVRGEDHPDTLRTANNLALDLRDLGEVQTARGLDQDTLNRRRRILGQDHPDTLRSAAQLATNLRELGEVQTARGLDQDTLNRRRRILGQDHPDTLRSADDLALDLRALGVANEDPRA